MTDGRKDGREGERKEGKEQTVFQQFPFASRAPCYGSHCFPGIYFWPVLLFPLPAFPIAQPLFEDYHISISISTSPHNSSPICSFSCQRPQTKTGKKLKSISKFSELLAPKSTPNLFLPLCCHHHPQHSCFIVLCLI